MKHEFERKLTLQLWLRVGALMPRRLKVNMGTNKTLLKFKVLGNFTEPTQLIAIT